MAWIEAHQSLQRHPKLLHLSRLVKTKRLPLISHLMCLWWWALDYADDGYLADFDDEMIAEGAEWTKDPAEFVAALRTARWLDDDGKLHNWERYVGRLLDQRATSTKQHGGRARASTAARDERGRFVLDQQDASTSQHGDDAGPSTVDQHEPAVQLTVPDRTVPNQPDQPTEPDLTVARSRDEVFEALAEGCGIDWHHLTPSARGELNAATKALREAGDANPAEISYRVSAYRRTYPSMALTPSALAKHWPALANGVRRAEPLSTADRILIRSREEATHGEVSGQGAGRSAGRGLPPA